MNNKTIKIYDNIGSKFSVEENLLLIGTSLIGFKTLSSEHVDSVIPYLLKNKEAWESGLGYIKSINNKIYVERIKISSSSNNNELVDFSKLNSEDNRFYVFANKFNFDTGLHNTINVNDNITINDISCTYLVDISTKNIVIKLSDPTQHPNLCIDIKTNDGDHLCKVALDEYNVILLTKNSYIKLISDGNKWHKILNISSANNLSSQSNPISTLSLPNLSIQSNTAGLFVINPSVDISGSLLYNTGDDIGASNIYYNQTTNRVLLGSNIESEAQSILSTSGNYSTIFNNTNNSADFIVKGSGDKNLFFGYEGRLGLNIPSGARPQTSLHIVSNSCQEGIRLENRNQCYPANITLYHKPNSAIAQNSTIASLNLSAKNSSSNQVDYVKLVARANSYTTNATKGEFAIQIEDSNSKIEALKINSSGTFISNNLYISALKYNTSTPSGYVLTTDNNGNISINSINNIPINISTLKYTTSNFIGTSGNILISDGSGNLILTNVNNTPIINLLDGGIVSFTGVCS